MLVELKVHKFGATDSEKSYVLNIFKSFVVITFCFHGNIHGDIVPVVQFCVDFFLCRTWYKDRNLNDKDLMLNQRTRLLIISNLSKQVIKIFKKKQLLNQLI